MKIILQFFAHIINHKMYKLFYYKSDQITTLVQRLNSTSERRRFSDIDTTLYLGRRRRDQYPTYIQRHVFAGWYLCSR